MCHLRRMLGDEEKRRVSGALIVDKWDKLTGLVVEAAKADSADLALIAGLTIIAEFGRTLELIAESLDQLASKEN